MEQYNLSELKKDVIASLESQIESLERLDLGELKPAVQRLVDNAISEVFKTIKTRQSEGKPTIIIGFCKFGRRWQKPISRRVGFDKTRDLVSFPGKWIATAKVSPEFEIDAPPPV
jgi:nucleoid DNA-binding protein